MRKINEYFTSQSDSFFVPLADAMTIIASIFFIIFLALLFSYRQSIIERQKIIEEMKQNKMIKAMKYMSSIVDNKSVKLDEVNRSLILNTEFLFDTGSYQLKENGKAFIENKLVKIIESILADEEIGDDITIAIEGHSDCQLFKNDIYENWVLSAQRAISVLRDLENTSEIIKKSNRIKAIGYGDKIPFRRSEEEEQKRKECCEMINKNLYTNYKVKKECVNNVLVKDRRSEIKLEFSPEYIEALSNKYNEFLIKQ